MGRDELTTREFIGRLGLFGGMVASGAAFADEAPIGDPTYAGYAAKIGPAADAARCVGCTLCHPKCPQHIDIRNELKKISALVASLTATKN